MRDIDKQGFKKNSPYKNKKSITIQSPSITMSGVEFPILGTSQETGEKKIMMPNQNYNFMNTKKVKEIPLKNDADFLAAHLSTMSEDEQDAFVDHYQSIPDDQRNEIMQSLKSGGTIHINPANKGKFTETKKRTGKSTEELTHSKNPLTRKRAVFAQNAKKWNHKEGGQIDYNGHPEINLDNLTEGTFFVPDNKKEMLKMLKEKGYDYQEL